MHFYYLAYKVLIRNAHNVEHIRVAHTLRNNKRARNLGYSSFGHCDYSYLLKIISEPTAFSTAHLSAATPEPLLPETPVIGTTEGES